MQFSIRAKLLLASTILFIIPVIGFQYIKELETFLRQDQQQRLLENARIIASVISSQNNFHEIFSIDKQDPAKEHIFVPLLTSTILLDGFNEDWQYEQSTQMLPQFYKNHALHNYKDPLEYSFLTGAKNHQLYLFVEVKDKNRVYQAANSQSISNNDHILIMIEDRNGALTHYIISTHSPGTIQAKIIIRTGKNSFRYELFPRIQAVWQETASGYNVEIKIPQSIIGANLALAIVDVDDETKLKQREIVVAAKHNSLQYLSSIVISQPKLNRLLKQLSTAQSKTWLINKNRNIVSASTSIDENSAELFEFESPDNVNLSLMQFIEGLIRLVYQSILPQPDEHLIGTSGTNSSLNGSDIDLALSGTATTLWRTTNNNDVNILRAVYPVFAENKIIGAIAVEKSSNSILLLQNRAVEILLNTSIVMFLLSAFILISFASRLSTRIRRLRNETNKAIGQDGKINIENISAVLKSNPYGDEIDDLQRSYADMLIRLGDYNRYLEGMASKLSHELRTPITVVKSSLENIESNLDDAKNNVFLTRAKDGVNRLNDILTRMSEATRLEQSLKTERKKSINVSKIISACVEGYQIAHGKHAINIEIEELYPGTDITVIACADLIAQLLDKLVSNALDFTDNSTPILVKLIETQHSVTLSVLNTGSLLPDKMQANLFESMVSVRDKRSEQPHLGLGLYIVRLIADFHAAKPFAKNIQFETLQQLTDFETTQRISEIRNEEYKGVEVGVIFPLAATKVH